MFVLLLCTRVCPPACREAYVQMLCAIRRELLSGKEAGYKPTEDRWRVEREWYKDLDRHSSLSPLALRFFAAVRRAGEYHDLCRAAREAMLYANFASAVFEIVDMWCRTSKEREYATLTYRLVRVVRVGVTSEALIASEVEEKRMRPRSARPGAIMSMGSSSRAVAGA